MTPPDDFELMTELDRREDAVGRCPEEWWAVSIGEASPEHAHELTRESLPASDRAHLEQLTTPLDDQTASAIIAKTMAACHPAANDPGPSDDSTPPRRWIPPTVLVAGLALAAALGILWIRQGPDGADSTPIHVIPHRLELGGTAHVLGPGAPGPRTYGPNDELLLRAVPLASGPPPEHVELHAVPMDGGARLTLSPRVRMGDGGAVEVRAPIAQRLEAGRWTLRLELGDPRACMPGAEGCIELATQIQVVDE